MLLNYKLRKINQTGGSNPSFDYGAYKDLKVALTMTDDKSEEKTVRLLMYYGTIEDTNTNVFFCREATCNINDDPFIRRVPGPVETGGDDNPPIDPPDDPYVEVIQLRLPINTQLQGINETFRSYFWETGDVKTGIETRGPRMNKENTLKELNNYIIEFIKNGHNSKMNTDASWSAKLNQLHYLQKKCYILKESLKRQGIQIDNFENLSFDFSKDNSILISVFKTLKDDDPRLSKHVEVPVTVRLSYLKNDLENRIERSKPIIYKRDAKAEGDIITKENWNLDLQSMKFLYNYKSEDLIGQQNINGMIYNIYKATINCVDPLLKDLFGTSIGTQT